MVEPTKDQMTGDSGATNHGVIFDDSNRTCGFAAEVAAVLPSTDRLLEGCRASLMPARA